MYVAHVGKSMYALQLERWFTLLGRDNIKVCMCERVCVWGRVRGCVWGSVVYRALVGMLPAIRGLTLWQPFASRLRCIGRRFAIRTLSSVQDVSHARRAQFFPVSCIFGATCRVKIPRSMPPPPPPPPGARVER